MLTSALSFCPVNHLASSIKINPFYHRNISLLFLSLTTYPSSPMQGLLRAPLPPTPSQLKHCGEAYIAQIALECHLSLLVTAPIFDSFLLWMALSLQKHWAQNRTATSASALLWCKAEQRKVTRLRWHTLLSSIFCLPFVSEALVADHYQSL